MDHDDKEWIKILRGIDLSFEIDKFWREYSKVLKNYTLMSSFRPKKHSFSVKNYRRVMFNSIENWCKIWRETDLRFQNCHEQFDKFSPEDSGVPKKFTLMSSF